MGGTIALDSGVSLGELLLSLVGVIAVVAVGWGSLVQRVTAVEKEVEKLASIPERLARIEENTKATADDVKEIKEALREPPTFAPKRKPGP